MRLLLSLFCVLFLAGCVTGSAVVTGDAPSPKKPESIEILREPPESFRTIGTVEAKAEVVFSKKAAGKRAIRELKEQAAKIGANAVILTGPPERLSVPTLLPTSGDEYQDYYEIDEEYMTVTGTAVLVDR